MTAAAEPLRDFAELRRAGISYAQEASGSIWTDYNLHDPGVTLLEQTCFALSEIAYQADLPVLDLMTNAHGRLDPAGGQAYIRHAAPEKVLASAPVTRGDLAAWLCARPEIDSVDIAPPAPRLPCLYDITVVPSEEGEAHPDPEAAFRGIFADVRPLCTALGSVRRATPVDVMLHGKVEIGSETVPERAAAALWLAVSRILSGTHLVSEPAKRADVWKAPERMLPPAQNRLSTAPDLSRHLARLRDLPGIRDIEHLEVKPAGGAGQRGDEAPRYLRLRPPRPDGRIGLDLRMDGAPVTLSAARLREEYTRLAAEVIAASSHHIDRIDWDVLEPGRHRRFTHAHVDALLPELYRLPYPSRRGFDGHALFAQYRGAIDAHLRDMVETLSAVPDTFVVARNPGAGDPVRHRLLRELLDYLIALQGCEMPATRHSGLHRYMTTALRHRFDIAWRLEYLLALPELHRVRGTGPGPRSPGGFLAELAILCDLDLSRHPSLARPLEDHGLTLDPKAKIVPPRDGAPGLDRVDDPFDMLVPEQDEAAILSREALSDLSPFIEKGRISPHLLSRLAEADAFAAAPQPDEGWLVLFDPGEDAPLHRLATVQTRAEALVTVGRLRATWRHLNRVCESIYLVEHLPTDAAAPAGANTADLLLPGFTARCAMESFRSYVEARVLALAPAHLHIRVHWLAPDDLRRCADLVAGAEEGGRSQRAALLRCLEDLAQRRPG